MKWNNAAPKHWLLIAALFFLGISGSQYSHATTRVNEPPTIICNSCNLGVPYPDGALKDVRTTLGVLTWALSVGNVKVFPWGTGAYICREAAPATNSECVAYWQNSQGVWTGSDDIFLSDSFCLSHFNATNWPYDRCAFDPPSGSTPPPESQPIRGPICIVDGVPKCWP